MQKITKELEPSPCTVAKLIIYSTFLALIPTSSCNSLVSAFSNTLYQVYFFISEIVFTVSQADIIPKPFLSISNGLILTGFFKNIGIARSYFPPRSTPCLIPARLDGFLPAQNLWNQPPRFFHYRHMMHCIIINFIFHDIVYNFGPNRNSRPLPLKRFLLTRNWTEFYLLCQLQIPFYNL